MSDAISIADLKPAQTIERSYWIIEMMPGAPAFTTYTVHGQQRTVFMTKKRIGPFGSAAAVADYLADNSIPGCTYSVEPQHRIIRHA